MNVEPTHQKPWDWRAAMQFISGGTGAGLMFFTALASISDSAWLYRTGFLALALVALGLFFVWLKLGRRIRPLFVFINPRTSWMSREALFSIAFMFFGGGGILLTSPILALVGSLFGLGYLYSQAQMLKAARGIPAWREPRIVPLMTVTGLVEGASTLAFVALLSSAPEWLVFTLFVLVIGRWAVWTQYSQKIYEPGAVPVQTVEALAQIHRNFVLIGHLAPALLLAAAILLPANQGVLTPLAGTFALVWGWILKFTLMTRAAYNQGFALAHTPARTPGFGGGGVKPGWTSPQRERDPEPAPQGTLVHAIKTVEME